MSVLRTDHYVGFRVIDLLFSLLSHLFSTSGVSQLVLYVFVRKSYIVFSIVNYRESIHPLYSCDMYELVRCFCNERWKSETSICLILDLLFPSFLISSQ